jgi:hypothetical protein
MDLDGFFSFGQAPAASTGPSAMRAPAAGGHWPGHRQLKNGEILCIASPTLIAHALMDMPKIAHALQSAELHLV